MVVVGVAVREGVLIDIAVEELGLRTSKSAHFLVVLEMLGGLGLQELFEIDLVKTAGGDVFAVDGGLERVAFVYDLDSAGIEGDVERTDSANGGDGDEGPRDVSYGGLSYPMYLDEVCDFGFWLFLLVQTARRSAGSSS